LFRPVAQTALVVLTLDGTYAVRWPDGRGSGRFPLLLDLLRRRIMNVWTVRTTSWAVQAGLVVRADPGALPVAVTVTVQCRIEDPAELARALPSGRASALTELVRQDLVAVLAGVNVPPPGDGAVTDYPRRVALAVRERLPAGRAVAGTGISYGEGEVSAEYEGDAVGQAAAADEARREIELEQLRLALEELRIDFYRRIVARGEDWVLALSLHQGADPSTVLTRLRERRDSEHEHGSAVHNSY
jgi:hypothetical protein